MLKKLRISLNFSNLVVRLNKAKINDTHNLCANFIKILRACKHFSKYLANDRGNIPRPCVMPRFSDLVVIDLSLTAENMEIDSECYLFAKLEQCRDKMPILIHRSQYNDRRKFTAQFNIIRNYAKDWQSFFSRIISKVSALTVLQYLNMINNRHISRIKFALA